MNRLIIIGASGHGRVVADIAKRVYDDIVFLDNDSTIKACSGFPVLGRNSMLPDLDGDVFIAVGNANARKRLQEGNEDRLFPVLIHPSAVIAEDVVIGAGSVVMAGVVINPGVKIGKGCIVNTSSSVDHDCCIADYCHISVGSHLCGTVRVGENVWIGAGAIVSNNVSVHSDAVIGAGAVVIKNVEEEGTFIGVPAKKH